MRLHEDVFDRSIDVRVSRLRRKLATSEIHREIIRTERGFGYSFAATVEWDDRS
jgi:DNA-binding response OmpR family regulator